MNPVKLIVIVAAGLWATVAGAQPAAYVPSMNSDNVAVIDTATPPRTLRTITSELTCPFGSAVSPAGDRIYITNTNVDQAGHLPSGLECDISGGGQPSEEYENTVAVLNGQGTLLSHIKIESPGNPGGVAVSPDGSRVYVANFGSGSNGTFSVIDAASEEVIVTLSTLLEKGPLNVAVSPDDDFVYVALANECMVAVIEKTDAYAYRVATKIAVGTLLSRGKCTPMDTGGVAVSPDGKYVYVVNNADNSVSVIDARRNLVVETVTQIANCPVADAVSPDGRYLYVTVSNGNWDTNCGPIPGKNYGYIAKIDTRDYTVQKMTPIEGDFFPYGIAVTPDGRHLYVTDLMSLNVAIIDTSNDTATVLQVGAEAFSVGMFIGPP